MANFNKGILGPFRGKVGTIVGSSWKGIDYMRSLPKAGGKKSEAQLMQQLKFRLAVGFIKSMASLVKQSFIGLSKEMSAFNSAVSYLLKHAIAGTAPNFSISYADVLISRGELPNVLQPVVVATAASGADFKWISNAGTGIAHADDRVILLAYEPETNTTVYSDHAAIRSTEQAALDLSAFHGRKVHTYIGLLSDNGKEVANSIYTGEVVVA